MANKMKTIAMLAGLSFASLAFACNQDGTGGGFLPENNLYISVNDKAAGGLSEARFNAVIDKVITIYSPIVSSLGGNLSVERNWTDGTVNAYASQSGKNWKVAMFGGLARHSTITEDGFALVVCHELGHHIGGAPKKGGSTGGGWWGGSTGASSWASNEGQSDYFATLKCLRKSFLNDDNATIVSKLTIPASLSAACSKSTKGNKEDTAMCVRTSMAGMSVANLFAALGRTKDPKFETPDTKVVSKTDDNHPAAQCRLDTYLQGSLCDINMNEDVSNTDEVKGTCHSSLGMKTGTRPLCWFKPAKK